jgi:hypothetical protein
MHEANRGQLIPKILSGPFTYTFHLGEKGLKFGCGAKLGASETNAVIRHQLNQEGFPTSGVSTTPIFERAKFYATAGGKKQGYVYKIGRSLLDKYGVKEFIVTNFTVNPSVPEDQEVILVASDFGPLSQTIILAVLPV